MTRQGSASRLLTAGMLVVVLVLALAAPAAANPKPIPPDPTLVGHLVTALAPPTTMQGTWSATGVSWTGFKKVNAVGLAVEQTYDTTSDWTEYSTVAVRGKVPDEDQNITIPATLNIYLTADPGWVTTVYLVVYGSRGTIQLKLQLIEYVDYSAF